MGAPIRQTPALPRYVPNLPCTCKDLTNRCQGCQQWKATYRALRETTE